MSALAGEDIPDGFVIPKDLSSLVLSDITVFIDPVDGTREFVEGRLEAVTSLLGISYRGRAVAGIMGIPFHPSGEVQVVWGVVGSPTGLVGAPVLGQKNPEEANDFVVAISKDLGAKEVNSHLLTFDILSLPGEPCQDPRILACSFSQLPSPHCWCLWVRIVSGSF